jgi:hypothetical protein
MKWRFCYRLDFTPDASRTIRSYRPIPWFPSPVFELDPFSHRFPSGHPDSASPILSLKWSAISPWSLEVLSVSTELVWDFMSWFGYDDQTATIHSFWPSFLQYFTSWFGFVKSTEVLTMCGFISHISKHSPMPRLIRLGRSQMKTQVSNFKSL